MSIDFDSFFRERIESLLIKSSWVEAVREKLGLKAVSQVWVEHPEWYFWIREAPGVYSLALVDAEVVSAGDQSNVLGRFTVKCYPYPDNEAMAGFSTEELAAVHSDLFDCTHSPRIETRKKLQDPWFTVGSISILIDSERNNALLTYDSLEHILTCSSEFPDGGKEFKPTVIRDVPGWEIGYPLFNCLVGLYAFFDRSAPCFAGATQAPGFKFTLTEGNCLECRPSQRNRHLTFSLLFQPLESPHDLWEHLWRERLDPEEIVAYTGAFSNAIQEPVEVPGIPHAAVIPLWWDLATGDYRSELSTTCGCADHEHHSCSMHHTGGVDRS